MGPHSRRACESGRGAEIATVLLALMVLAATAVPVSSEHVTGPEAAAFRAVNDLPDVPFALVWIAMQAGNIGATLVAAFAALRLRRRCLATSLAVAGLAAWLLAKVVKAFVERERPAELVDDPVLRHAETGGLGWVSGHAAVTAALLTVAWSVLSPRWRRLLLVVAVLMNASRVYVGNHLPLDMVGGSALGVAVGAMVVLVGRLIECRAGGQALPRG